LAQKVKRDILRRMYKKENNTLRGCGILTRARALEGLLAIAI